MRPTVQRTRQGNSANSEIPTPKARSHAVRRRGSGECEAGANVTQAGQVDIEVHVDVVIQVGTVELRRGVAFFLRIENDYVLGYLVCCVMRSRPAHHGQEVPYKKDCRLCTLGVVFARWKSHTPPSKVGILELTTERERRSRPNLRTEITYRNPTVRYFKTHRVRRPSKV